MSDNTNTRDSFTSNLGMIAATLGSAVGLGNLWMFPYKTGTNGGASFLLIYLLCTILVGLPVMISEIMIGRKAKSNPISAFPKLHKKSGWFFKHVGTMGALSAFLILAFYTEVAGWVFYYIFEALKVAVTNTPLEDSQKAFGDLIASPEKSLLLQWGVLLFVSSIIVFGVSKGIEKTTKRLMPLLFILLIAVCIRSLTLDGASKGLEFLFKPDFSKITALTFLTAMGLAFFKLSLGMGTMLTYGSYYKNEQNIPRTTIRVMLADLTVSLLAGIAIFPAVFAFKFEPTAGPSLLFITIPKVFEQMPFGNLFMAMFFLIAGFAATGAMLSIFEVVVTCISENLKLSRVKATFLTFLSLLPFGALAALSNSKLSDYKVMGKTFFDLFDYLTSYVLMPLGGFLIIIFAGYIIGKDKIKEALSNENSLKNQKTICAYIFITKYIAPVLVLAVMLNGFGVFDYLAKLIAG
jgi:NSS family neurotransmitter:Na+ symporter